MILHTIYKKVKLETDTDKLIDKIFRTIKHRSVDLDNNMEGSRFSFKFTSKLTIKQVKVIVAKHSSYIKSLNWLRCKNTAINPKVIMIDVFSIRFCFHKIITKSKTILKEYQISNYLLICITERVKNIKQQ